MIHTTGHFVHQWNFRVGGLAPFYRNGFYATILYEAVMLAIKPMILLEWIRIFASAGPRTAFNWTCYILAAINILLYLGSILTDAVSCTPREYWWDRTIEGHCANTRDLPIVTGVLNAVIDLFILLLPQGIIWRLQMSRRKRLGVSLVFFVGIISVAAAITRTVLSFTYAESYDVTYNFSLAGTFTLVEMTFAIVVFAAPTVPKPTAYLVKQAGSSIDRLIKSNRSGVASFATGADNSKVNAYHSINERDPAVHLMKLRSSRSKGSERPSTGADSELELALPAQSKRHTGT
ncbi:putative ribosomal protein L36e [Rosellinia necatrix]|uniref:Putative ribosomal protein L36e n=1 Tax=Rosellinia necatrix TaxID=77044 RepID=A0A1W2TI08_ROSNE|nr:putative ribosomal protein L36e [Rosellinia necatrix]